METTDLEDEEEGTTKNVEINGSVNLMNRDLRNEVPLQRDENPEKTSGSLDQLDLVRGGAKRPHKTFNSDKEKLPMGSSDSRNGRRQFIIIGQSTSGSI